MKKLLAVFSLLSLVFVLSSCDHFEIVKKNRKSSIDYQLKAEENYQPTAERIEKILKQKYGGVFREMIDKVVINGEEMHPKITYFSKDGKLEVILIIIDEKNYSIISVPPSSP